ncbi:MAG: hypothetical protein L0Y44_07965 [Phycisphaerales bacterium]|nr:hypothetical protein [Phycisphaerales bacterium]MCI0630570.1 hypothetical protein [Phycisphaerales bacterium]MCI0675993.1 hypothetical protein [Phycisphaerales bacterium]
MLFTGEYEHTIDSKQRLAIPAEIRAQMDPETHGKAFYLAPGANGTLWLWPELTFVRMTNAMEQTLLPGDEAMEFEELIYPESKRLEIDSAGRVRIPEQMLAEFGLGQTVIILGMKDHLELRDPQQRKLQRQQTLAKRRDIMIRAREALNRNPSGGGMKEGP